MTLISSNFRASQRTVSAAILTALLAVGPAVVIADSQTAQSASVEQRVKEGWREGSIQARFLMSKYLNPLDISVDVSGDKATLTGYVDSDVSKALATEVALSVDGIDDVDNQLRVEPDRARETDESKSGVGQAISDTAITTKVKARLLANNNVSGTSVSVETKQGIVVLTGTVDSEAESELAYYIARNTDDVRDVDNRITVNR